MDSRGRRWRDDVCGVVVRRNDHVVRRAASHPTHQTIRPVAGGFSECRSALSLNKCPPGEADLPSDQRALNQIRITNRP
jgi:hypothetical protein